MSDLEGSGYDVALVCLNGHTVNSSTFGFPDNNADFCSKCGARAIAACPACERPIRGRYRNPMAIGVSKYRPPAYCNSCGAAMPWTAARLSAARALIEDLEDLSDEEREKLAGTLDDLVSDTPMTQVAAGRFKKLVAKAGHGATGALRDILVDIASETAKKALWGQ